MAMDVCVKIGRRISLLRNQKGWTQEMLADHARVTREHLSELENGHKEMGVRTLDRICSALNISLSEFFDRI
jgi:transcriptional regulator with XRE-family HTH domain